MNYHFRNLVFEGGGVKGIAYVGAIEKLHERGIIDQVRRIGGTSAGAINAVLLSLGYGLDEMNEVMSELDFNDFSDASKPPLGSVSNILRLRRDYGWCKGEFFKEWIGDRIAYKTGTPATTFAQLQRRGSRDLFLVGTNLSTGFAEVFSAEHSPSMSLAEATRRSMSIPMFFAAVRDRTGDVFVDGGVFDNYPVKLFDRMCYLEADSDATRLFRETDYYADLNRRVHDPSRRYIYNKETLGFRLDTGREIRMFLEGGQPEVKAIDGLFDYVKALSKALLNVQSNQHLHSDDWCRTVYIDTKDIRTTQFDLSPDDKAMLIEEGKKGVASYFEWYDKVDPEDTPKNHPDYVDH